MFKLKAERRKSKKKNMFILGIKSVKKSVVQQLNCFPVRKLVSNGSNQSRYENKCILFFESTMF